MCARFQFESVNGTDHSKESGLWEDNIKMDVDWIHVAQNMHRWAIVNTATNPGNFFTS
jgi:hypothetical protein